MPFGFQEPNGEYRSVSYYGEIKNPRELNVKNSFDLIEYLNHVSFISRVITIK